MQIAIPIFDQLTALDCVGPYEVLQRLPGATVAFVGKEKGNVRTDNGFLGLAVDYTFDEISSPNVILVPGGVGTRAFLDGNDHEIITWLKNAHMTSQYTTSVCTGSLLLGRRFTHRSHCDNTLVSVRHFEGTGVFASRGPRSRTS